ncbi:MAG: pseudouridine synthase, partial [Thermodesulfobacteriota bacterium]|nr:pseudouridine synthase [Thermodesulfobacteriota bacterium]
KSNRKSSWVELTILEGRNRIIRRFFDSTNHPVARLIRTAIGDIALGELKSGEYRYMHKKEVKRLIELSGSRDKKKLI